MATLITPEQKRFIKSNGMLLKNAIIKGHINSKVEYDEIYKDSCGACHDKGFVMFYQDYNHVKIRKGLLYSIKTEITDTVFNLESI